MAQKQRITSARRAAAPVGADPHDPVEAKALVSAHPDTMRYVPSSYERVAPEMGRRKCQIHFVVTASGRAPAPRCFAAQWADCCFSRSVFPFSKVLNKCRAQGLPDRKAGNSSARHILAGAIAPAAETRCPLASRGPKAPASVRPATGGRWPFVVPGRADPQGTVPRRRGKRGSRFLVPPGEEFSGMPCLSGRGHRPCHSAAPVSGPAGGQSPRPAPDPPPAGASPPPCRALVFRGA